MDGIEQLNLILGWSWIFMGFLAGALLGMFFERPDWKGGYGSLPRRMLRLGHISFFGLAIINLLFAFTVDRIGMSGPLLPWASVLFALGALSMPACCLLMSFTVKAKPLFGVPVASLLAAGSCTLWMLLT